MRFDAEEFDLFEQYLSVPISGRERRSALLTEAGEATLSRILNARRIELYQSLLWERIWPELEEKYPLAALSAAMIPKQARRDALRRMLDEVTRDGGVKLYTEYPELARFDRVLCDGFTCFLDEVFQTLEEKRKEIAETFFGGRDFGRVTAVRLPRTTDVSTRSGSRATLYLETEGGGLYFKPRVCAAERLYAQMMERLFPDVGTTCRTVIGKRASFAEPIERIPLASSAEADEYYRRMGALTAVFYVLQTEDMHSGNLIVHGPVPVPIDLECLIGGLRAGANAGLPGIASLSLLQRHGEGHTALYAEAWDTKGLRCLPQLDGHPVTVRGREEIYLSGFHDACRRIRANAGEISDFIREHPDVPLRAQVRGHNAYAAILRGMLKPARLRSAEACERWLEQLWSNIPQPWRAVVRELEREDLLRLDFPDFYVLAGDTAIRRPDGTVALDGTLRAPMDCAALRLAGLSEAEINTAMEDLRGILAAL